MITELKDWPISIHFEGIGTVWNVYIKDDKNATDSEKIVGEIKHLVGDFENSYSRFIDSSLISKLNTDRRLDATPIELIQMLKYGLECAVLTDNHFTIAIGTRLEDIGYDKSYSFRRKKSLRSIPALEKALTIKSRTATLHSDITIDLGGFGKGWLMDSLAKFLKSRGYTEFLIDAGGDIYVDTTGTDSQTILLDYPLASETRKVIGEIVLTRGSVACSSPKYRSWTDINDGEGFHHLINPYEQKAISEVAAVFTHGPSATASDTASTCMFVSPRSLHKKIADYFSVSYCIVYADGNYFKTSDYPGELY